MSDAQKIIEWLRKANLDEVKLAQEILSYAVERALSEIDVEKTIERIIYLLEERGKIPPGVADLITALDPSMAQVALPAMIKAQIDEYLLKHDLQEMIDNLLLED